MLNRGTRQVIEVSGEAVLSVVAGMGTFQTMARRFLADAGLVEVSPGQWYPMEAWLDAFAAIAARVGDRTVFLVGTKIPETALLPPDIVDVPSALAAIDVGYHMNHRLDGKTMFDQATGRSTPGIGNYTVTQQGAGWATVTCDDPYPCDFDAGIVKGFAMRYAADRSLVQLTHAEGSCRKKGHLECTYRVLWV